MAKAVKLSDIAKVVGVSTVTVSKALSGQKGVSDELRTKIISVADEMGYKYGTEKSNSYYIALLIHEKYFDKFSSFYQHMYQNITKNASEMGSFVIMEIISQEADKNGELPKVIQERKADGVIVLGKFSNAFSQNINSKGDTLPIVYLDSLDLDPESDSVISDSFFGAYALTSYLVNMGHEKIGYVGNIHATGSIMDRYLGYTKACLENGLETKSEWVIKDRENNTGILFSADDLLIPKDMPTAFVCNSDLTASVLIKRLENDGYRIPEDISVVGYDNFIFPGLCDVEITSYEVDIARMVRRAVENIICKISGEAYQKGICIIEGKIVFKQSVKKIK